MHLVIFFHAIAINVDCRLQGLQIIQFNCITNAIVANKCYFWMNLFFKDHNHAWWHTFALTAGKRALKQVARNTPPPKQLLKATTLLYLVILSYSICIIRTGIRMPPNIRANTPSRHRILATAISILRRWAVIPLQRSICILKNKTKDTEANDTSPGRLVRSWTASLENVLETSIHGVT